MSGWSALIKSLFIKTNGRQTGQQVGEPEGVLRTRTTTTKKNEHKASTRSLSKKHHSQKEKEGKKGRSAEAGHAVGLVISCDPHANLVGQVSDGGAPVVVLKEIVRQVKKIL